MKKQGIACYLNILAAVLGLAGVILTAVSSSMSRDNALLGLPMLLAAGIAGVLLACLAVYAPNRWGNHNFVSAISVVAAIPLYTYVFGACLSQRIMMIAGLFSYNSGNTVGWSIFYVCIAAWVCLLVGILFLIVGSFLKSVQEPEAA